MDNRNQQVLALAYKKAKSKIKNIIKFGITPGMSLEEQDKLVLILAAAKAIELDEDVDDHTDDHIDGQRWYVGSLLEFSKMTPQERLDTEYEACFADIAGEAEIVQTLGLPTDVEPLEECQESTVHEADQTLVDTTETTAGN